MKKKVMAIAAGVCTLGMLLSGCGGSGSTASAGNVITAFNSEPQNALIPGETNETGGGKVGQLLYPGAACCGTLVCRQMGIDERSFLHREPCWYTYGREEKGLLPVRPADGNKGTFGKALLIAGSEKIGGAAMMAAKSTFRAGAMKFSSSRTLPGQG